MKTARIILIILLNLAFYGAVIAGGIKLCRFCYSYAYEEWGDTVGEIME